MLNQTVPANANLDKAVTITAANVDAWSGPLLPVHRSLRSYEERFFAAGDPVRIAHHMLKWNMPIFLSNEWAERDPSSARAIGDLYVDLSRDLHPRHLVTLLALWPKQSIRIHPQSHFTWDYYLQFWARRPSQLVARSPQLPFQLALQVGFDLQ
jgi:hypothetical protein